MKLTQKEVTAVEAMNRFMNHIPVRVVDNHTGREFIIYGKKYPLDEDITEKSKKVTKAMRRKEYMDVMEKIKAQMGTYAQFHFEVMILEEEDAA